MCQHHLSHSKVLFFFASFISPLCGALVEILGAPLWLPFGSPLATLPFGATVGDSLAPYGVMALDPRHLGKPSCFDGTQEGSYDEWRFQLVAYLTAVDPRFGDVADDVARRATPHLLSDLPPDDERKNAYLMLYAVIVGCIKNRQLRLIMDTPSRDATFLVHETVVTQECWWRRVASSWKQN